MWLALIMSGKPTKKFLCYLLNKLDFFEFNYCYVNELPADSKLVPLKWVYFLIICWIFVFELIEFTNLGCWFLILDSFSDINLSSWSSKWLNFLIQRFKSFGLNFNLTDLNFNLSGFIFNLIGFNHWKLILDFRNIIRKEIRDSKLSPI
jgi:hypothetical protein